MNTTSQIKILAVIANYFRFAGFYSVGIDMVLITFSKYERQFSHAFVFATIAFAHASLFVLVPYSGMQSASIESMATEHAMLVLFSYIACTPMFHEGEFVIPS